jgi:lipoyl(octanoyl) transferase
VPDAPLDVRLLGRALYLEVFRLQEELAEARRHDRVPDTLLLLEHPPTITLGRRTAQAQVFASSEQLALEGVELHPTNRGGLATYHGPGQLVGYPIVALRTRRWALPAYVRWLEHTLVDALGELGVESWLDEHHVGVWAAGGKIAAIGIGQRHGVSMHGFALNVAPRMEHFDLIDPCGIGALGVTSVERELRRSVSLDEVTEVVRRRFSAAWATIPSAA